MSNITITTPLYYVNDKPHLGSIYTTIASDAYARFQRLNGNKVIFITGVDEHGQKIQRTAELNKTTPINHCNTISQKYKSLWEKWSISNDYFIRTTDPHHQKLVEQFFQRVQSKGDIRVGNQQGWYCIGCEEYKEESKDSSKPLCPIHLKELEWRDEENLFFCLSNYQTQIENLLQNPEFIQPKSRRNEIINFVSKGLKDFSISRLNLEWGIPVPGYDGHTFYVWFDALLGYISALLPKGQEIDLEDLNDFSWPPEIHIIGKDILRFHAVYWPAMLLSADLDLPTKVFGHGFLTREGQKMGKSLGNVLDPELLLNKYGEDAIRWYLLSDFRFGQDGDFQQKRFIDLVNNDLANTIGNLLNRTSSMSRKWFTNKVPDFNYDSNEEDLKNLSINTIIEVKGYLEDLSFKEACSSILNLASSANLYLNDNKPWTLIKEDKNKARVGFCLYNVLETIRIVAILINPILPKLSKDILNQLSYDHNRIDWKIDLEWGKLKKSSSLPKPSPILVKLEDE